MPFYQKLGEMPRKHHIWFSRNGQGPTYKNEGIAYEHVITTEGFNEAYSIMYHLRPPTRVRNVKLLKCEELKKVADSPLRHHHLRTANIPRSSGRFSTAFAPKNISARWEERSFMGAAERASPGSRRAMDTACAKASAPRPVWWRL